MMFHFLFPVPGCHGDPFRFPYDVISTRIKTRLTGVCMQINRARIPRFHFGMPYLAQ